MRDKERRIRCIEFASRRKREQSEGDPGEGLREDALIRKVSSFSRGRAEIPEARKMENRRVETDARAVRSDIKRGYERTWIGFMVAITGRVYIQKPERDQK